MTLLPIKDDFLVRTLAHVPGLLGKLGYMAELRQNGKYVHWGLARVYGEEITQRALGEVHCGLFLQVLRTPLHLLSQDILRSAAKQQLHATPYLQTLLQDAHSLVPQNLGGSKAQFCSVITAVLSRIR